jgi:peptide/nickel transport system substrate-binding protein
MENRFGLKDLLMVVLMVGVIGVVLLAMWQYDRQFVVMQRIEVALSRQADNLAELNRTLQRGGFSAGGATTQMSDSFDTPKGDPFYMVEEAKKQPDFARGDWLVENYGVKFARIAPLGTMGDLYGMYVHSRVLESLAYLDPTTLGYQPLLARDWQVKDNSKAWHEYVDKRKQVPLTEAEVLKEKDLPGQDKPQERSEYIAKRLAEGRRDGDIGSENACPPAIEMTFQLRRGVTFSDGHPFNADDVVFTYEWIMNPKVEAPRERSNIEKIRAVKKINDYEVVFEFREPYYEYLDLAGTMDIMPKHFYEAMGPEKFNQSPGVLIGTGPFKLSSPTAWNPGTPLELVRNETYWGERATFEKIKYHEVEGENPEIVLYRNREVDRLGCTPDQYEELKKDPAVVARSHHIDFLSPDNGYVFVGWNQKRNGKPTLFTDKRVRQAMTMLIDRERLIKDIWLGYGIVATGPFASQGRQFDPSIKPWPYDPARATKVLESLGFKDRDGDGIIEDANGTPFKFKFTYSAKLDLSKRIGLFLKDSLARAGIVVDLEPTDWTIMLKKMDNRDFDAITLSWSGSPESDVYQMFSTAQIKDAGDNFINYSNPLLDQALEKARTTVDEKERVPLWHKCHQILHEDQPYTFLLERKGMVFIDSRIQNVKTSKLGLNYAQRYDMPIAWYVPKVKQKWSR